MAQWLCAAPRLREFTFNVTSSNNFVPFVGTIEPGLTHSRLRYITIAGRVNARVGAPDVPADYGVRLRQVHFPRLGQVVVYGETYPVESPTIVE
jgi:hypothetical protein